MAKTIRRRSAARYYIPPEPAGVMTRPLRMAAFVAGAAPLWPRCTRRVQRPPATPRRLSRDI